MAIARHPGGGMLKISITIETAMDAQHAAAFYELYLDAFGPLRTRAAARQVLHRDEFFTEMGDERVWKYVAWNEDGEAIGLSTLTQALETVPWISPDYFRHRFPDHAARDAIYYLGFVLAHPNTERRRVFEEMLLAWRERLIADRAICAWDMCAYNRDIGFGDRIENLLRPYDVEVVGLDSQTYYATQYV